MDALALTWLDVVVAILLLASGVLAFMRGFVHEILAVVGWVAAIFAALYGLPLVRPWVRDTIPLNSMVADGIAAFVIFLVVLVVITVLARWADGHMRESALNALDRSLGFLYGLVRGAVIVSLAWLAAGLLVAEGEDRPGWVRDARVAPVAAVGGHVIMSLVPEEYRIAKEKTRQGRDALEDAREMQETYEELSRPDPAAPDEGGKEQDPGYTEGQRRDLEQLIENRQKEDGGGKQDSP